MIIALARHLTTGASIQGKGCVEHQLTAETSDWIVCTVYHRRFTHKQWIANRQRISEKRGIMSGCLPIVFADAPEHMLSA